MWSIVESMLRPWSGRLGMRLRRLYYARRLGSCGRNLRVAEGVIIQSPQNVHVGDDVIIDRHALLIAGVSGDPARTRRLDTARGVAPGQIVIGSGSHLGVGAIVQGHGGVEIGEHFTASAGCCVYSLSNDPSRCREGTVACSGRQVYYLETPVLIGRNVWLGLGVSVVGGDIGSDVFVKPNSVVISSIPENTVAAGSPAAVVTSRF